MLSSTLYLDMDGVLADFDSGIRSILVGISDHELDQGVQHGNWLSKDHWRNIVKRDVHFYRHLSKMPLADELVRIAYQFKSLPNWKVCILTAVPVSSLVAEAFHDKVEWVNEYYPGLRVHFGPYSHNKQDHCLPGDILVDDRSSNCREWERAGGKAVEVKSGEVGYRNALNELSMLYSKLAG